MFKRLAEMSLDSLEDGGNYRSVDLLGFSVTEALEDDVFDEIFVFLIFLFKCFKILTGVSFFFFICFSALIKSKALDFFSKTSLAGFFYMTFKLLIFSF